MNPPPDHSRPRHRRRDGFLVALFLHALFFLARYYPPALRRTRSMWAEWCWRAVRPVRQALLANAARVLGPQSSLAQRTRLSRSVIEHFYRFVTECGEGTRMNVQELRARISATEGLEVYRRTRAAGRGAIVATAHLGSFEVGLAALTEHEPHVHVVFQEDTFRCFEKVRSELRRRLGVHEAPVEEGWPLWLRLREALGRNEVVMMQADRVLPGQKGIIVPFLHGHLRMPTGPIRLAAMSGAPIIPVFAIREGEDAVRIMIESPIFVKGDEEGAMRKLAGMIERQVRVHPEQWMMVQKAFVEDQERRAV